MSAATRSGATEPDRNGGGDVLRKAFEILKAVAAHGPRGTSVLALSRETGIPRTTVGRLVATMDELGLVHRPADRKRWILGAGLLRLAQQSRIDRSEEIQPVATQLAELTSETVLVAVPVDVDAAKIVSEIPGTSLVSARIGWVGRTVRSPASGFVRLMLAQYSDEAIAELLNSYALEPVTPATVTDPVQITKQIQSIRHRGYAVVKDELELGLAGIGAPFYDDGSEMVGMVTIYLPTYRLTTELELTVTRHLSRYATSRGMTLTPPQA